MLRRITIETSIPLDKIIFPCCSATWNSYYFAIRKSNGSFDLRLISDRSESLQRGGVFGEEADCETGISSNILMTGHHARGVASIA